MWKKQKRGGVAILGSGKGARNTQLKQKSTQGGVDSVDSVERGTQWHADDGSLAEV